jgi:hypothetical protein
MGFDLGDLMVPTMSKVDSDTLDILLKLVMLYYPTPGVVNFSELSVHLLAFPIVPIYAGDFKTFYASST